jgi:hypothetical protein
VKKHHNFINVLHYLKTFHKKPTEVKGPHDKLSRGSFYARFTLRGEIKPRFKNAIEKAATSMASQIHFSILETKPKQKNEFISMLKNMQAIRRRLFAPIVQPIIQGVFKTKTP